MNRKFLTTKRYQTWPHFDVAAILADWDQREYITLDLACDMLNIPSPKDGEIKADHVAQAYLDNKIDLIAEYCLKDVDSTYKLFKLIKEYQPRQ